MIPRFHSWIQPRHLRSKAGRRRITRPAALLAVAALAISGLAVTGQRSAADPPAAIPSGSVAAGIAWQNCRDGFQCARVRVPLDYDQPKGEQISLALVRLPASTPTKRIGSLFLNPGGPGGSGAEFARGVAKLLPLQIRARFDIVGFDPRGIGGSTALRCFDTFDESVAALPPFIFPVTPAQERQQWASNRTLTDACVRHGGPILNHMSTADVARDLNFLRQAVGDRKLNYLGYSYGSVLGQTYANMFPSTVRALVIDGVIDPIAWTTGRGAEARLMPVGIRMGSDVGGQATLRQFFTLCEKAGTDCALAGHAKHRFAALAARLRLRPITLDDGNGGTFEFTYDLFIAVTLTSLYQPESWSDLATFVADLEAPAGRSRLSREFAALREATSATQEQYPNFVEGSPGVACSDSTNPRSFRAWQTAAALSELKHGYFGRPRTWAWSACQSWPASAGQDRYQGPWTARTAKPVLIVGNFFDPATRYQGAVTASELLPNSRLLSYAGWGHVASFIRANYCIDRKVTDYLVSLRMPRKGTVCQPEGSPFGPLSPAPAAALTPSFATAR
jgi:pimeloyl-ACP methyl ester carboxylesterase